MVGLEMGLSDLVRSFLRSYDPRRTFLVQRFPFSIAVLLRRRGSQEFRKFVGYTGREKVTPFFCPVSGVYPWPSAMDLSASKSSRASTASTFPKYTAYGSGQGSLE